MQTKICSKCGKRKTIKEFHKDPNGKYGVRGTCKECRRLKIKDNRKRKMIEEIKGSNKNEQIDNKKRKCKVCGEIKDNDGYYDSDLKHGYIVCKECRRKKSKKNKIERIKKGEQK